MPVETRYMRSDQQTVNGLTAYKLDLTESAALIEIEVGFQTGGLPTARYGIRVWKRSAGGVETEITAGSAVAIGSFVAGANATQTISATWDSPQIALATTDSIVVRVYADLTSPPTTLRATFTTEQLGATKLDAAKWTVYYRVRRVRYYDPETGEYSYFFYWRRGISGDSSYISNFTWTPLVVRLIIGDGLTCVVVLLGLAPPPPPPPWEGWMDELF